MSFWIEKMPNEDRSQQIRMPLASTDVLAERVEKLKQLIPEAFSEGKLDFERLRNALGDFVGEGRERYGLTWAGKADAIRAIQAPSIGTLLPCPEESRSFEASENVFIEGDNLEVLKLLQKAYHGKVKMIYIDPPYNTGNEFIYPDNFREGLDHYLEYSRQVSEGRLKVSTNEETSGRYHSKWLDMMYPRLVLGRNLLSSDGLIFISIDDHEVHNLRLLANEVFGEENFILCITWKRRQVSDNRNANGASTDHEYVLVYGREKARLRGAAKDLTKYSNPDDDPRGPWMSDNMTGLATKEQRPNLHYDIVHPDSGAKYPPHPGRGWAYEPKRMERLIEEGRVLWPSKVDGRPRLKRFLADIKDDTTGFSSVQSPGYTTDGTREVTDLMGYKAFDFPKPIELLKTLIRQATSHDESAIVLDYFAGSCTTADAVMQVNAEDGGNRRFIMVQLPEPLASGGEAGMAGFSSLASVGMERIRRRIDRLTAPSQEDLKLFEPLERGTLGCRLFKLASSNFKVWGDDADTEPLAEQLELFAEHLIAERPEQAVLYEILLKAGIPLTESVVRRSISDTTAYLIGDGVLLICLAQSVTQEFLRSVVPLAPQRVICLDAAFGGNDQLKTNTVLEMKSHGIEFRTI